MAATNTPSTTTRRGTSPRSRTARGSKPALKRSTRRRSTAPIVAPFSARLGVRGWTGLDPILLAALALEAPLLLVGAHGTAKTLLAERAAHALELELRHYNASLLNYDDLVGIPVPDDRDGLRYLGAGGAVWDAQFVFFDEINRCRPDLQNKLFPLVHEKRIAGEDLPKLRHRWAAINPPGGDDDFDAHYLGVEELDAALVDRFWFIVPVPGWHAIDREDRLAVVRDGADSVVTTPDAEPIDAIVSRTTDLIDLVDAAHGDRIAEYVLTFIDELDKVDLTVSPRRARVLHRDICAVHAARIVLHDDHGIELSDSVELAVLHALPQRAGSAELSLAQVLGTHRQAWETTELAADDLARTLLANPDPVERVRLAVEGGLDERSLSRLVTAAIAAAPTTVDRRGLAFVFSRALADHALTPAAWGPIADLARPLLTPGDRGRSLVQGPSLDLHRSAQAHLAKAKAGGRALEAVFLNGNEPSDFDAVGGYLEPLERFLDVCARFGVAA